MQIQTIFKAGNSNVVSIPTELLELLNLKKGSKVVLEVTNDKKGLILSKAGDASSNTPLNPNFLKWLDSFNKEYASDLEELAKK